MKQVCEHVISMCEKWKRQLENALARIRTVCAFESGARLKRRVSFKWNAGQSGANKWSSTWAGNTKTHANSARQDQNILEMRNPSCSSYIHHVHHHQDPMCTEIYKTYIIELVIPHTSHIQHQFDLNLTISNGSSKISSNYQTSNHDN